MSQATRAAAVHADGVKLRISIFTYRQSESIAVTRERSAAVRAGKIYDAITRAASKIDHIHVSITALISRISDPPAIRTERRMHADDVIVRELPDTAAIVIRDVNFLVPAARGDERDLAACNPLIAGER